MVTTPRLSIEDAASHLADLVEWVRTHHERVTVMVEGSPTAVLLAVGDLENLEDLTAAVAARRARA
ncbi:MAG: type II toxin-antitoxin system Phd/YefM family antitoxin [Actinomycetota bacterium]|nr:type II toxin-antitoxin system Phd/YefM family antitoxin [Actinomycetota bacterium]